MGEEEKQTKKEEASYIVKGAVKEFFKKSGKRTDPDALTALNKVVENILKAAVNRAEKNKRSTIRPEDL